jgi:CRP/FNR family transcriptional regulator, anaerobic regulatory protein
MQLEKTLLNLGLAAKDIEQFSSIFTERISIKSGQYVIKTGQTAKWMGIVLSGGLRYFYTNPEGDEITCCAALSGDFITSLPSFIRGVPSLENIKAYKDSELIIAHKRQWDELLLNNQNISTIWSKSMENLYIESQERVHNLIVFNAAERYEWLCKHQERFFSEVPDKYLASILGITPRHLSRLRAKRK